MCPGRDTGARAEEIAVAYLEARGLTLLERNFRQRFGELDIVMQHGDCLVFVEVRARSHPQFGDGLSSITRAKQRRLIRAARAFLATHPTRSPSRFDVVSVGAGDSIEWTSDAFGEDG